MYHRFKNRIALSGALKAETALYIGAGQESFSPMAVQGSLLKNAQGQPYIPGSSLKGVLRSFLESVQAFENCVSCKGDYDKKEKRQAEIKKQGGEDKFAAFVQERSCPACRLFGSGVMAGKLKFADAALLNTDAWMGTELRTGNAIDRDTHTAVSSALFDTEVIPSGTRFLLRITAENLTVEEAGIFSELMRFFAEGGITVGGRSRAGLGMVSVGDIEVKASYMEPGRFAPATESAQLASLAAFLKEKEAAYV